MARRYRCTAGRVAVLVAVVVLLGCGFALNLWLTCGHARGCVTRALVKQSHAALPAHAALTAKVGQQQAQHVVSAVAPLSTPVSTPAASASARVSSTSTVAAQQASFEALGVALSVQGSEARAASTNTTAAAAIAPEESEDVVDEPLLGAEEQEEEEEEDTDGEGEADAEEEDTDTAADTDEGAGAGAGADDASGGARPSPRGGSRVSVPTFVCDPEQRVSLKGVPEALLGMEGPGQGQVADFLTLDQPGVLGPGYDFSTCAVVGNGGVLLDSSYGAAIDGHSLVIRQNQAPTSKYKRHTGSKATMRILNKKWLKSYAYNTYSWLPKERNLTLVASRGERAFITKLLRRYEAPANSTAAPTIFIAELASRVGGRMRSLMKEFKERLACAKKDNTFKGGSTPSSGIMSVGFAIAMCKEIRVYGFGSSSKGKYHYYQFHDTERRGGDQVHSFSAEFSLIKQLGKDGYLTLCTAANDSPLCKGVTRANT